MTDTLRRQIVKALERAAKNRLLEQEIFEIMDRVDIAFKAADANGFKPLSRCRRTYHLPYLALFLLGTMRYGDVRPAFELRVWVDGAVHLCINYKSVRVFSHRIAADGSIAVKVKIHEAFIQQ